MLLPPSFSEFLPTNPQSAHVSGSALWACLGKMAKPFDLFHAMRGWPKNADLVVFCVGSHFCLCFFTLHRPESGVFDWRRWAVLAFFCRLEVDLGNLGLKQAKMAEKKLETQFLLQNDEKMANV